MSSTDGPFIPMVSSSPPPMDDGGFDEDEDDFTSFSHYGSDLVGSPSGLKNNKEKKPDMTFKPIKEASNNIHNGNGDQFGSFTQGNVDDDDDFGDFADASNGNNSPTGSSQNTLPSLTNGNSAHSDDWHNESNQARSVASSTGGPKQTFDLFSEFHSSNDGKDAISKDSTSISSMDDDFSDFSAFTSGAASGQVPDNEEVPDKEVSSDRNNKQSSNQESKNLNQTENIDFDTRLKDSRGSNESAIVDNSESAMILGNDRPDPKRNAFHNNNTLTDHRELTNDFADSERKTESSEGFGSDRPTVDSNLGTIVASEVKNYDSQNLDSLRKDQSELNDADDFASFSSFSKPSINSFSENNFHEKQETISGGVFTAKDDGDFGAFDSKPAMESDNLDSKPVTKDFGNSKSETTSSDDFGNFESETIPSNDFGNFAEFRDEEKRSEVRNVASANDDGFGEGFTSFQQTSKTDEKFADFGSFESTKVSGGDDFGEFGTFQESATGKSNVFSKNDKIEDDDFGDFGSFSTSNTASGDFGKFSTATSEPAPQTTQIPKVSGSKLEQVFRVCFPINHGNVETDNTINLLLDVIRKNTNENEQKKNKNGLAAIDIWDQLQNMERTNALTYQWADSNNNKQLLTALAIDTRNILSSKKRPTPIFASDLGLLIPSKAGEKVEKAQEPSPEETLVSTSTPTAIPDEETSTKLEFDWSGSGLTNPLDANSLNLDFFVVETKSSFKSNRSLAGGLDSEFLGLEMSAPLAPPPGANSIKPLDNILKNMQTSMVTQPKKDENLSQEANKVLSNLPHLSFMHAKVLMFPMNPVTEDSST